MLKRFIGIVLASFVLLTFVSINTPTAYAGGGDEEKTQQALSPEEIQKIREQLRGISALFGVEPTAQKAQEKPKDLAGVADKALDLITQATAYLSSTLEKMAPHVWRVMLKQQYANAIGMILPHVLIILMALLYMITLGIMWKVPADGSYFERGDPTARGCKAIVAYWIPVVLVAIVGMWGAITASESVRMLINPEYYAIRDLLKMIMRPGL